MTVRTIQGTRVGLDGTEIVHLAYPKASQGLIGWLTAARGVEVDVLALLTPNGSLPTSTYPASL